MTDQIAADSLITLHYRLVDDEGVEFVSTFAHGPATLQLGCGELAPPFEARLVGLPVGARMSFQLDANDGFGPRTDQLIQRVARRDMPAGVPADIGGTVSIPGPGGRSVTGVVRGTDSDSLLIDFNHPLSGRRLRFDVEIIGIL